MVPRFQRPRTVFIDFAKAFDRVDHSVLVVKLVALGLPDVIVRWSDGLVRFCESDDNV